MINIKKIQIKEKIVEAVKAFVTGISMLIPGVSGGTMALVFGFYDKLIKAVSNIFKSFWKSLLVLLFYVIFAVLGFFLFSGVMSWLTDVSSLSVYSFFVGAILGGIPMIFSQTGATVKTLKYYDFLFFFGGILFVVILSMIPETQIGFSGEKTVFYYLYLLLAGLLIAVALVIPGISFSHMLLVLGLYEPVLNAVKSLDILFLVPIVITAIIGVLLISKLLDKCMTVKPRQTFMMVLGFATASSIDIFRKYILGQLNNAGNIILSVAFILVGYFAVYLFILFTQKKKKTS